MDVSGFKLSATWIPPGPKWEEALSTWDIFWHVHIYFLGSIFALTALYTVHRILQLIYGHNIKENSLELIILLLVLLFSSTRSVILFVDPYHQGTILTGAQPTRVLWGLGTPCYITTNFFMIMLLLKDCSFTFCGACSSKRQFTVTVVIAALQLGLFVVKNSLPYTLLLLEQVCQTWSVLAQLFLVIALTVLCIVIKRKLLKSKGLEIKSLLVILLILATFIALIYCGATAYFIYIIGLIDHRPEFIDAWKWLGIETALRSSEITWSWLMMIISSKKHRQCLSLETPDYETYDFLRALVNYRNSESSSVVKSDASSTTKSSSSDTTSKSSASGRIGKSISQQSSNHGPKGYQGDVLSHESFYTEAVSIHARGSTSRGLRENMLLQRVDHKQRDDVDGNDITLEDDEYLCHEHFDDHVQNSDDSYDNSNQALEYHDDYDKDDYHYDVNYDDDNDYHTRKYYRND